MTKKEEIRKKLEELIKILVDDYNHDPKDLEEMTVKELEELLKEEENERNDKSDLYPNGYDEDSEEFD